MNFKQFAFIAFITLTTSLFAQTNFKDGYIIKISGDTLHGMIDYRGDMLMSKICKFKSKNDSIVEYSPNSIKAFRFNNGKYYVSEEINGKNVFVEYLINGKINIFYMRNYDGNHYYLSKDSTQLTEIPFEEEIKMIDNHKLHYTTTRHIGVLSIFMKDAPELQSKINSIKKPDHHNLIKIAEDYHNAVCQGEKCIIYEKNQPKTKLFLEPIYGIASFKETEDLAEGKYYQGGILVNIWLPQSNENLYFRTGALLTKVDFGDKKKMLYKFPIQFEYISPNPLIRPKFAVGFSFYKPFYHSFTFMFGINIKISESIFWAINYDIDLLGKENFPIIPQKKLSSIISTGLFIKIK